MIKTNFSILDRSSVKSHLGKMNFFLCIRLTRMDSALTTDLKSKLLMCPRKFIFDIEHFDFKISKQLTNGIRFIAN